jgi:ppGpp synthetase/RelA/SpoT-type nucleotidyltranferase
MNLDQYVKGGRALYAEFASVVAEIIEAAVKADPHIHLQHIQLRAKAIDSLRTKLQVLKKEHTEDLAAAVKDLAGCRVVLYTNSDVRRFLESGIVNDNFEIDWDRTKIHHPVPETPTADQPFISNNYVVRLKEDRVSLAEYAPYAGLACEVQVQTTLNHAWSETAHDITYKRPDLGGFGAEAMAAIDARMNLIMTKHLLPAGYEFQKVQNDLQRLASGKELFDRGALRALAACENNNERVELLERYQHYVLPNYADVRDEYPDILTALGETFVTAESAEVVPLDTPFGTLKGKDGSAVAEAAGSILDQLRYVDIKLTLKFLLAMFAAARTDISRARWIKSAESLAGFDIDVWDRAGATVQLMIAKELTELDERALTQLRPIAIAMLRRILNTEVSGSHMSSFDSFTLRRGTVPSTADLSRARTLAIDLLANLLRLSTDSQARRELTDALMQGTRWDGGREQVGLVAAVLADARRIVDIFCDQLDKFELDLAEHLEEKLLWLYRYSSNLLPAQFASDPDVIATAKALHDEIFRFRDLLNSNQVFVDYKTLVGYESVFPPAWSDPEFAYEGEQAFREQAIDALVERVTEEEVWFEFFERCASAPSRDLATFPSLGQGLERIGRAKPDIVAGYLGHVEGRSLANFIPAMLIGVAASSRPELVRTFLDSWLAGGLHLEEMTRYVRFASSLDLGLLRRLVDASIRNANIPGAWNLLILAIEKHDEAPELTREILMPALTLLRSKDQLQWLGQVWLWTRKNTSFYRELSDTEVDAILECVLSLDEIDDGTERLLAKMAVRSPSKVIAILEQLLKKDAGRGLHQGRLFPYRMTDLAAPLKGSVPLLLARARALFEIDDSLFPYRGGRLVASIFPHSSEELNLELSRLIGGGDRESIRFVLSLLRAFDGGEAFPLPLCKQIAEVLPEGDSLLDTVELVIDSTRTVSGEFGMVRAFQGKRALVATWLDDGSPTVRAFAMRYVRNADQRIAAEQRRSEESLAMRKLDFEGGRSDEDSGTNA